MKTEKIGNILQMQRGYDLPSSQMNEGTIPVVGSNGIVGYHDESRCITPTITIGRSGSAGKVHMYDKPTWVHNTALYVTDFKGNNPKYLYYLLNLLHLEKLCGSSVIPSLNRNVVYPMTVNFHEDRAVQDAIAGLLSMLDAKIALNREINRNLEAMARQLYDYWFVQFDFPDENGKPYKSSGGKMVWNEQLKREIPYGWKIVRLDGLTNIFTGKKDVSKVTPGEYKFFSCAPDPIPSSEFIFDGQAVLVSGNGSYTGRVSFYNGKGDLYQRTYACMIKEGIHDIMSYLYLTMKVLFEPYHSGGKHGSSIPYIVMEDLAGFVFPYSKQITMNFAKIVNPIFNQFAPADNTAQEQIESLRNMLLPLLMNGQVSVTPPAVNCDLSHD